jgi:hypothetical protein
VVETKRAQVFLESGVAFALLTARGEDLKTSRRDEASDFAIQGGVHADLFLFGSARNWALGMNARAYRWGAHKVEVSGAPSGQIPRLEIMASVGLARIWR